MNNSVKKYLVTTFSLSWFAWGIVVFASKFNFEIFMLGRPIGMFLYILGGVSPAVCEIILKKKSNNNSEFKYFLKSIVDFKKSLWLYVYAIGGALILQALPVIFGLSTIKQPLYIGFFMIVPMIIGGGLEEIGWRGLLQPELEKKFPHLVATLVVAIIWAFWHLPLWFVDGTNQQNMNFIWFTINAIMLSFFIGSVTYVSNSIFMAIMAHASINAFWEVMEPTDKILPSIILLLAVVIMTLLIDKFIKNNSKIIHY